MSWSPLFTRRKQSVEIIAEQQNQGLQETTLREDWNSFRDRTLANDRFYLAGLSGQGAAASSVVPVDNRLYLVPLIVPIRSRLAELGVCKTQGATSTPIRVGLYRAASNINLRPASLLIESVPIDTTVAAFHSILPDMILEEGILYYAAFVRQGGSALGFAHLTNQSWSIYGYARPTTTVAAATTMFVVNSITGSLPDPAGPLVEQGGTVAVPILLCRFEPV